MKIVAGFVILGGARLAAEFELPDDALAPLALADPEMLDDAALQARWRRSARTIRRLRDQRRLPYVQPSPRTYLYRIEDVRLYEAESRRGAHRRQA